MSLTKNDLIERFNRLGFKNEKSTEIFEVLVELLKSSLASGDDVLIPGFGKFCVSKKGSRRGRNPATGEDLELSERKVVTFKCSEILRDKIKNFKVR